MMKSEHIFSREATDFARAERVVALYLSVRSDCVVILRASPPRSTRHQKQRIFPYNYFYGGGVWGGADKKWKGKFFVLVSPLCPPKSSVSVSIKFESLPLHFSPSSWRARRARVYRACSMSRVRSHTPAPSHSSLAPLARAAAVLPCVSLVASIKFVLFKD
jgi:hypothetical protein